MKKTIVLFSVLLSFAFVSFCAVMAGESEDTQTQTQVSIYCPNCPQVDENEILGIKLSKEAVETSERALSYIFESHGGFNDMFKEECGDALSILRHESAKKKIKAGKLVVELSRKHIETIKSALYTILGGKDAQDATNEFSYQVAVHDKKEYWSRIISAEIGTGYHSVGAEMVPLKRN